MIGVRKPQQSAKLASLLVGFLWILTGCATEPGSQETTAEYEVLPADLVADAEQLRDRALNNKGAYEFLEALTVEVGPRPAGSDGDRRAVVWAQRRLEALGFSNVRAEPVTVPQWVRGYAFGEIVEPFAQPVSLVALGGSVGTPDSGVEAPVLEVEGLEALAELDRFQVEGKIVFFNRRMRRAQDGSGYGEAVAARGRGAIEAAKLGAVGMIIRSVGTSNNRLAHTGGMRYDDHVPKIPAAALSNPDADLLEGQLRRGEPVRFRFGLGSHYLDDQTSANVIGEIPGRELPEEVVLLVGHLDSWDLGTGAIDDGAGCAIVTEAARLVGQRPTAPRRTIRVFLAANEEFGLSGARAYGLQYADDLNTHVVATEADFGAGRVWAMRSRVAPEAMPVVRDLARLLAPLGIEYNSEEAARGGADLRPLRPAGVPFFDLRQDGTYYFDYHHTANDTLDKVEPDALAQNVAAYATLALVAAEMEGDFGRVSYEE